jgi:hypothetical protein
VGRCVCVCVCVCVCGCVWVCVCARARARASALARRGIRSGNEPAARFAVARVALAARATVLARVARGCDDGDCTGVGVGLDRLNVGHLLDGVLDRLLAAPACHRGAHERVCLMTVTQCDGDGRGWDGDGDGDEMRWDGVGWDAM